MATKIDKRFLNYQNLSQTSIPSCLKNIDGKFLIKAPGRVNLIGEHIDYCGFPVLPIAIEKSCYIKFSVSAVEDRQDGRGKISLDLQNHEGEKYPGFSHENLLEINESADFQNTVEWNHYVLAGILGVVNFVKKNLDTSGFSRSFTISGHVYSDIPPGAGLSSSSALVVASGLLMLQSLILTSIFKITEYLNLTLENFAQLMAESEKYVGTQGGGMDQAISVLAEKNKVGLINFLPTTRIENFNFSDNLPKTKIIVAHSGKVMEKARSTDFNERVLCAKYGAKIISGQEVLKKSNLSTEQMKDSLKKLPESITLENLIQQYGPLENMERFENLPKNMVCSIRDRMTHIVHEQQRVLDFVELLKNSQPNNLELAGSLLNDSQKSLKYFYNCSCPEIDFLCEFLNKRRDQVLGCRLTGAGWGGCIVAIVRDDNKSGKLVQELEEIIKRQNKSDIPMVFETSPSSGVEFFKN